MIIGEPCCYGYSADVVLCDGWTDYDDNYYGWSRFFVDDTILINYIARE